MSQSQRTQHLRIAAEPPSRNQQQADGCDLWDQVQALLGLRVTPGSAEMFTTYYKRYDPYWSSNPRFALFFLDDLPPRPLCSLPGFHPSHGQKMARAVATIQRIRRPNPMAHPRPSTILPNPGFLAMSLEEELAGDHLSAFQRQRTYAAPTHGVSNTSSMSRIASVQPSPKLESSTRLSPAGSSIARSGGVRSGAEIGVDHQARRPRPDVPQHGLQRIAPHGPIAIPQNHYARPHSAISPVDPSPRQEASTMETQRRSADSLPPAGGSTAATTETGKRKRIVDSQTRTSKKLRSSVPLAS
ncbi:hypothetical protein PLEOSDRAFT_1107935 [Pleurotus ostreatus PC15]|uniref:Uncharacterized protein n=1 Tax=Pleurotus ostreatus (strain PC15) TaxID=1137138 RepID=A0A067NLM5_PLEO1|nr:hypothetical protein PLEOSDRAFT_1107935 [Pleurotus ostreatus PC15]